MNKLTLKAEKPGKKKLPVFIDIDLLDQIKEVKSETNLSIQQIAEKCIAFGLENLEIEGDE